MDTDIIKLNSDVLVRQDSTNDTFLPPNTDRIMIVLDGYWYIRCYDNTGTKIVSVRLKSKN